MHYMMTGNMSKLRTEIDRDAWERFSLWVVRLSDGTTVYRNDEEIGESSWALLHQYLLERPTLSIESFSFGFRDNTRALPDGAQGYYFRNSVVGSFSGSKSSFLVGILDGDRCIVEKWEVPEITYMSTESRPVEEAGVSLIRNNRG